MIPEFIDKSQIPHKPGVYLFKAKNRRVIYVGKAIDLYHRVTSYFSKYQGVYLNHPGGVIASHLGNVKTAVLVEEIASVETIVVESELEALILEANLIKKYLPEFNVSLKDDKDYLYIRITKDDFPKVATARINDLKGSLRYFGPFPSSRTVRETLKALRRVFPWCSNAQSRFGNTNPNRDWKPRACFYYHLGLCPGSCVGEISRKDYRKNIFRLAKLLEGKKDGLEKDLMEEMEKASADQLFEEAGGLKKMIEGIRYLTQPNKIQVYLENPNFLEDQKGLVLEELKDALNLENIPERIEGYDISNTHGKEATGSMVVLTHGEIDKGQYRKFKIRISGRPNDVAMMREMIRRRFTHAEWPMPDLIVVDGGKGQVNSVQHEIRDTQYAAPVFGLAKRMEWLYSSDGMVIKLSRHNLALKLIQKLRDEAHRFALSYHRQLRNKSFLFPNSL